MSSMTALNTLRWINILLNITWIKKLIWFLFIKSEDQLADILTKIVFTKIFYNSLDKLGIKDIYAPN